MQPEPGGIQQAFWLWQKPPGHTVPQLKLVQQSAAPAHGVWAAAQHFPSSPVQL